MGINSANVDRRGLEVSISDPKKGRQVSKSQPDAAFSSDIPKRLANLETFWNPEQAIELDSPTMLSYETLVGGNQCEIYTPTRKSMPTTFDAAISPL